MSQGLHPSDDRPAPRSARGRRVPYLVLALLAVVWWYLVAVSPPPPGGPDTTTYEGVVERAVAGPGEPASLSSFWKAKLAELDPPVAFREPAAFQPYTVPEVPPSACVALEDSGRNSAFYCPGDETISWDADFLDLLSTLKGQLAPVAVVAHEYGHHVSHLLGSPPPYSIQEELQADCFAGMYLRHADRKLGLATWKMVGVLSSFFQFGDDPRWGEDTWFSEGRHGSRLERLRAIMVGFATESLRRCMSYQHHRSAEIATVGTCGLAVASGTRIEVVGPTEVRVSGQRGRAEVRYLRTSEPASPSSVFRRLRRAALGQGDARLLGRRHDAPHPYGGQSSQPYERSYEERGRRVTVHGVLAAIALEHGGAIGLNAFESGPAATADEASWSAIEGYLEELQGGMACGWPAGAAQNGGASGSAP
jgi:hypothetical protein